MMIAGEIYSVGDGCPVPHKSIRGDHKMFRISASNMNLIECPRCFWNTLVLRAPRPSMFSGLPGAIHRALDGYRSRLALEGGHPPWMPEGVLVQIPRRLRALDPLTNVEVVGELDALLKTPQGYWIVDFKTASTPHDEVVRKRYYQHQMDTYHYLLEQHGYAPVLGALLIYFSPRMGEDHSRAVFPFNVTCIRLQTSAERVHTYLTKVREILGGTRPPLSIDCQYCNYIKQIGEIKEYFSSI